MDTQTTINTDLHTPAAYRTLDQLENFRIVVKLKKIANRHIPRGKGSTLKDGSAHASLGYLPQPLEETIRWQKKIPGPKDKGFTKPPKSSPDFIFTYVDTDGYEDEENTVRNLTDGIKDCPSIHLKRLSEMTQIPKGKDAAPMTKPKRRPLLNTKYRIMHIMACLRIECMQALPLKNRLANQPTVQYKKKTVEKRLCTIRCYDNGLVLMTPGISATGQTNEFVIEDDIFQFTIENGSRSLSPEDEEKEWSIYSDYHSKYKLSKTPHTVLPPLPDDVEILLHINGQLRCSRNFIKSNLYVRYFMDLPGPSWGTLGTMPVLSACTQISQSVFDGETGQWVTHFAFPLEMEVLSKRGDMEQPWPRLFFEVGSVDWWDRNSVEGYGYLDIPKKSGE